MLSRTPLPSLGTNTAGTNITWTANTNGVSINAGGYAGTGLTTTTTNGTAIVGTNNTAGLSLGVPAFLTTAAAGGAFSAGVSTAGNTAGATGVSGSRFVLVGTNNITLSQTTDANGLTVSISGGAGAAGNTGYISAGGATASLGTVVFSNSNGVSFGVNGQTVTGSHNGLTTQSGQAFSADASSTFQTLTFQDSNGVSFSNNAGALRVTHALQFTSATSAITSNAVNTSAARIQGVIGSNTTYTSGSVSLRDLNGITWQSTTGQAFQITHDLQYTSNTSAITSNALHSSSPRVFHVIAATNSTGGGTASLSSNVSFSAANGLTFYTSAGNAVVGSYTVPSVTNSSWTVSDSATSATVGRLAFTASNGLTMTLSTSNNGNHTVIGSYTVPSVTEYFSKTNTTFNGANISGSLTLNTAGLNVSLSVAAPGAAAEANWLNLLGANTSGNTTASGSTIGLSGINLTLSGTNDSKVVLSVPATSSLSATGWASISVNGSTISIGASTTANLYAVGNTFGTSSGTADIRTMSLSAGSGLQAAASNSGWVIGQQVQSFYEPFHDGVNQTMALAPGSVSQVAYFGIPNPLSASFLRIPIAVTTNSTTLSTLGSSLSGSATVATTYNAVVYSQGTGASSRSLISVASGSGLWGMLNSISAAANGTQYSITQSFVGQVEGASFTSSTQYSISNTNYSYTTNQIFTNFSGNRFLDIPFANSLTPGAYWLIWGMSTSSNSNSARVSAATNCNLGYASHFGGTVSNVAFGVMGSTNLSSGPMLGAGSFSTAGGGTTSALPISAISSSASHARAYFQLIRSN